MTESEWLSSNDPTQMLAFHRGKASNRKFGFFGCSCCRRVWHLLTSQRSRKAIEVAESFADGKATASELEEARVLAKRGIGSAAKAGRSAALRAGDDDFRVDLAQDASKSAARAAASSASSRANWVIAMGVSRATAWGSAEDSVRRLDWEAALPSFKGELFVANVAQADLLRDIVGNPFVTASVSPGCLTPTVSILTTAVYEERTLPSGELDPTRLAGLSIALEEAGCDNTEILTHLRGPGPHVRGCWVVDLLLGKA